MGITSLQINCLLSHSIQIQQSSINRMGFKRNKYNNKQGDKQNIFEEPKKKKNKPIIQPQESLESIIQQVLQVQQLFSISREKLNKTEHHCYLLSSAWFRSWKQYTGYDAFVREQDPQKTPLFGKMRPDKINQDIIDKQPTEYVQLPEDLYEFTYLNVGVDQSAELNKEFFLIDADLWYYFQSKYTGHKIMRPIKRVKGKAKFDVDLLEIKFVVLSDPQIFQIKETDNEYFKANYSDMIKILKQQVPSFWTIDVLRNFFFKYIKSKFKFQGTPTSFDIWKFENFIPEATIKLATGQTIRKGSFNFMGRLLNDEEKKQYQLSDFIKSSYTLFIRFGQIHFNKVGLPPLPLTGICETCLQKHKLEVSCNCKQVLYCSKACAAEDKSFHQKICELAYESDDDQEYQKKIQQPQDSKCGLINLGNTCYMNASLQCLVNLPTFTKYFTTEEYMNNIDQKVLADNKGIFLKKFAKFIKKYQSYEVLSPWSIKTQINHHIPAFRGYDQHDASQLILSLLNTLNDGLQKQNKELGYAKVFDDTLLGSFQSSILCPDCNVESKSTQAFLSVSLPIKPKIILHQFNYVVIDAWNKYRKGALQTDLTWGQAQKKLEIKPDQRRMVGVEGSQLSSVSSQLTIMQIADKHPKQSVVIYDLKPVQQGCIQIQVNLAHMQNQAINHIGYPIFISQSLANTLYEIYLMLADIVGLTPEAKLQLETFVVKSIQKLQNAQNERAANRIQDTIQQQFEQKISPLLGFEVLIVSNRKQKKTCVYCHRKCAWCILPFSFSKSVQEYVALGQKTFRLQLVFSKQIDLVVKQTPSETKANEKTTLLQCIDEFHKPERLDQDNFWFCILCEAPKLATKLISISHFPKVLMIHIKRFKQQDHRIKVKDNEPISYPEVLDIAGASYRFNSAIIHEGSLEGGHYWAICRKKDGYYLFNDDTYKKIENHFNNNAYILFYELL